MKRKILSIISLALTAMMLFVSCDDTKTEETTESTTDTLTEATEATGSNTQETATTEAATEEETTEAKKEIIGTVTGYTSKGYAISEKNGITYVDGVLVANKTYALPESYNPGDLLGECSSAFNEMKSAAAQEGLNIWNASGFRSYELQESLYNRYSARDGKEAADRYSARPGHSEHQSGLAIDLNEITSAFKNTKEGKWVAENCHKYGFILRYPEGKEAQTGYMYEPWHIRYVGVDTATAIYNSGLCLEEYYGITSAYLEAVTEETTEEITTAEEATAEEATSAVIEETTASAIEETTALAEETTEVTVG